MDSSPQWDNDMCTPPRKRKSDEESDESPPPKRDKVQHSSPTSQDEPTQVQPSSPRKRKSEEESDESPSPKRYKEEDGKLPTIPEVEEEDEGIVENEPSELEGNTHVPIKITVIPVPDSKITSLMIFQWSYNEWVELPCKGGVVYVPVEHLDLVARFLPKFWSIEDVSELSE